MSLGRGRNSEDCCQWYFQKFTVRFRQIYWLRFKKSNPPHGVMVHYYAKMLKNTHIITHQYQFGILKTSNLFPNTCILKSSLVMIGTRSPRCLNLISASLNGILKNSAKGKTWRSVVQEFECTDRSNSIFQRRISVVNNFFLLKCGSVNGRDRIYTVQ